MKVNNFFKLIIAIGISELAGIIGSFFTISAIPVWYAGLTKPMVNPPSWVFGPVWTALYALMGIAAWLVWKQWSQGSPSTQLRVKTALTVFGLQLFLNAIWSIIFFGFKSPGWALVDIVALWLAIVWTMIVFYKISKPAAYLLVPYLLWVGFASYLNYSIWILNR
ncbi:MAG: TspO/MBR family protein [bacterium]|nr:TspO/MBR family protein [bacterium]